MNSILSYILTPFSLFLAVSFTFSQENKLTTVYKEEVIQTLSQMLVDNYVSEEIGIQTKEYLLNQLEKGYYNQFKQEEEFAAALTQSTQEVTKDKHMLIRLRPPYTAPEDTPERLIEEKLFNIERSRAYNGGFNTVKVLEGNVGYIDLRGFTYFHVGKEFADAYMRLIENTDAIILDLSKNGGGDPEMVKYLCSYFLENDIHINSLYSRERDQTTDFFTIEVHGRKLIDIPLFVIISKETFSGAEEFAYNMQTQKRATVIGQTSRGGANPGRLRPLSKSLEVFIPTGKAINPITKTNWEGIGVIPDIELIEEETFDKTLNLAVTSAIQYKEERNDSYKKLYNTLISQVDNYSEKQGETQMTETLTKLKEDGILNEWDINNLGYKYLLESETMYAGAMILKINTLLFPNYANGFDSYGEALFKLGQTNASIESYEKAVQIAKESNDPQLSLYEENLQKVKSNKK